MKLEYSIEEINSIREFVIKLRDRYLGINFDPEGAIYLSHIIAILTDIRDDLTTKFSDGNKIDIR